MKYRQLRNTDIRVSVIAMGTWQFGGDFTWGEQEEQKSINAVHAALDVGINFFDSAEMYGNGRSEEVLGKALVDRRDRAVIASKVLPENLAYDNVVAACERSLKALDTEYIDLYQIHWPNHKIPLEETIRALEDLKRDGKIRAIGVSNFGPKDLDEFMRFKIPVTNQLPYSLIWRAIEYEVQELCVEIDIGILCYSSLAQGMLTGKFNHPNEVPRNRARTRFFSKDQPHTRHKEAGQEELTFKILECIWEIAEKNHLDMGVMSLAWLYHQPAVTSMLAGARNPQQVQENATAGDLDLDDEVLRDLDRATHEIKSALGKNIDMYQTESRIR